MHGHKIRWTMTHACIYALSSCGNISLKKKKSCGSIFFVIDS